MSERVNVHMSKIMFTPIKVGVYIRDIHQLSNPATARKYHMTTSLLRWRVKENQGLMFKGKQISLQSNMFMTVYENIFKFMRICIGVEVDFQIVKQLPLISYV